MIHKLMKLAIALHIAAIACGGIFALVAIFQLSPGIYGKFENISKFDIFTHVVRLGLASILALISGVTHICLKLVSAYLRSGRK